MIRLALLLTLIAQPAFALSCLPHWIQDSWQQAESADAPYIVVAGHARLEGGLVVREAQRARVFELESPETQTLTVPFSGLQLVDGRFSRPVQGTLAVTVNCVGPWCGSLPDVPWIALVRQAGDGTYTTETGPCSGFVYADRPQNRAMLRSCATGGTCLSASDAMGN